MTRFLLAERQTGDLLVIPPQWIAHALVDDLLELYGDLRGSDLRGLWRIARDLVLAVDGWAEQLGGISGEERMGVALDVAWQLLERTVGAAYLREAVITELADRPLGAVTSWIARRILSPGNLQRLVRFVLDLAVRELRLTNSKEEPA